MRAWACDALPVPGRAATTNCVDNPAPGVSSVLVTASAHLPAVRMLAPTCALIPVVKCPCFAALILDLANSWCVVNLNDKRIECVHCWSTCGEPWVVVVGCLGVFGSVTFFAFSTLGLVRCRVRLFCTASARLPLGMYRAALSLFGR